MPATLAEIPLELRFDSAMENAARYRAAASRQYGRFFAHRRELLLRKAERMEVIAKGFLDDRLGTVTFSGPGGQRTLKATAPAEEMSQAISEVLTSVEDAIAAAAAYKKRRRQKNSFERKMRELGYEPVGDPTDQAPENWRQS